jgi:hypothetical protein
MHVSGTFNQIVFKNARGKWNNALKDKKSLRIQEDVVKGITAVREKEMGCLKAANVRRQTLFR